jgi:hypothetical protein
LLRLGLGPRSLPWPLPLDGLAPLWPWAVLGAGWRGRGRPSVTCASPGAGLLGLARAALGAGLGWAGLVWAGLALAPVPGLGWAGLAWCGVGRPGPGRAGPGWAGHACTRVPACSRVCVRMCVLGLAGLGRPGLGSVGAASRLAPAGASLARTVGWGVWDWVWAWLWGLACFGLLRLGLGPRSLPWPLPLGGLAPLWPWAVLGAGWRGRGRPSVTCASPSAGWLETGGRKCGPEVSLLFKENRKIAGTTSTVGSAEGLKAAKRRRSEDVHISWEREGRREKWRRGKQGEDQE